MALFKFRNKSSGPAQTRAQGAAAQADSVETLRRRARHRLIGATILVLLGVIVFPLLIDQQPRPVSLDLPIVIPDRNAVQPLAAPPGAGRTPATAGAVSEAPPSNSKPNPGAPQPDASRNQNCSPRC